jgi:PPOX class probable F420-dependent enzyme
MMSGMDERAENYLATHHTAAMITLRADGTPHAVRCGIALVDGKLWSSGVPQRVRTRHLRRDPRATLFVFGSGPDDRYSYVSLDCTVTILDGPDAAEFNRRLFTVMQAGLERPPGTLFWEGTPRTEDEFTQIMVGEQRLIYEFEVHRAYGMF